MHVFRMPDEIGTEIVRHPEDMHIEDAADPFNRWVSANCA